MPGNKQSRLQGDGSVLKSYRYILSAFNVSIQTLVVDARQCSGDEGHAEARRSSDQTADEAAVCYCRDGLLAPSLMRFPKVRRSSVGIPSVHSAGAKVG